MIACDDGEAVAHGVEDGESDVGRVDEGVCAEEPGGEVGFAVDGAGHDDTVGDVEVGGELFEFGGGVAFSDEDCAEAGEALGDARRGADEQVFAVFGCEA